MASDTQEARTFEPEQPVEVRFPVTGYEENLRRDRGDHLEYYGAFIEEVLPDGRLLLAVHGFHYAREQYMLRDGKAYPIEQEQSGLWHVTVSPDEVVR